MKTAFSSVLNQELEDFFELRESQGHNAQKERYSLLTLDKYLCSVGYSEKNLTPGVVENWLESLPDMNINTKIVIMSRYRQFAAYLCSLGYSAFIPDRPMEDKQYIPYIFSEEEQNRLILAADKSFEAVNRWGKRGGAIFAILLRILIGCGCRLGELRSLETRDVDLENGILCLRNAKGNKDRYVPMHDSLVSVLKIYAASGIPKPDGLFFPNRHGDILSQSWARSWFDRTLTEAGIEKPTLKKYERNICIHCLRHSFAVTAFRRLDQSGCDMYDEMPILSTYMGHDSLRGTEKYLHMSAENSADIMEKMDKFNEGMFPEVQE